MRIKNTNNTYGSVSKFFHWVIALLVISMIIIGSCFGVIQSGATKSLIMQIHKSIGVTILILMLCRLLWRFINISPSLPPHTRAWEKLASHTVHFLLYVTVIAMPLSGIIMSQAAGYSVSFWWLFTIHIPGIPVNEVIAQLANQAHYLLAWLISGLIFLHVIAGLKHHFYNKDDVLKRMCTRPNQDD